MIWYAMMVLSVIYSNICNTKYYNSRLAAVLAWDVSWCDVEVGSLVSSWGDSSATAGGGELTMRYGVVSMKSCTTCATPSNNSSCSSHGVWFLEFSSLSTTAAGGDLMTRYAVLSIKSCTSSVTPATKSSWLSVATSTYKDETFTYFTSA